MKVVTLQQSHFHGALRGAVHSSVHPLVIAQVVSEWGNSDSEAPKLAQGCNKKRDVTPTYILFNMSHVGNYDVLPQHLQRYDYHADWQSIQLLLQLSYGLRQVFDE